MSVRPPLYVVWFVVAAAIHAMLLFGLQRTFFRDAAYSVATSEAVDLELVESAPEPAPASVAAAPPPPEPAPPPPEPKSEPPPVPETPKPEFVEPNPETNAPKPKPNLKPVPKPRSTASRPPASSAPVAAAAGSGAPGSAANVHPAYLYNPNPPYPAESRAKGEQGLVLLTVTINEQGNVTSVSMRQGSGFPRLDAAASEGVRSWRFRPAQLAGFPVATTLEVPIRFRIGQ